MFGNLSYKMDINEIKKIVRERYMQIAYNYLNSGEYSKNRNKRFSTIFVDIAIYILINAWLSMVDNASTNYFVFATCMTLLSPAFIISIFYFQNASFRRDIKQRCTKVIMQDLMEMDHTDNKNSQNVPDKLTKKDIQEFDFAKGVINIYVDDVSGGNYKDIPYNLQELKLYKSEEKSVRYEGSVLTAIVNSNIDGWINVCTKESVEKIYTFKYYFLTNLAVFCMVFIGLAIIILNSFSIFNGQIYAILLILSIIISYFAAKHDLKEATLKLNIKNKQLKTSDITSVSEKISIYTSDNIKNIDNKIISVEFADLIEKLKILFNTPKIYCKFSDNKIILAINTRKNMFELGDLFKSPLNKKVADRFISQVSGILLFLDYVDKFVNNNSCGKD